MKSYGQYCPIARASELFAERWTPIIVRNLLAGCRTFTEIRAGAPGIPKALLPDRRPSWPGEGVSYMGATKSLCTCLPSREARSTRHAA